MQYDVLAVEQPLWEAVPALTLKHAPWLEANSVSATAQLCHSADTLFLRMEAREAPVVATLTGLLDPVCCDSCLEFFLAPLPGDQRYLNFEVNPLGTLCLGFGAQRPTRVRQVVKNPGMFRIEPFFTPDGWGFTMEIPLHFLRLYFPEATLSGSAACNFYKCGDKTPSPHFLAWSPLSSDTPDFHRRQDSGTLNFLSKEHSV